MESDIRVIVYPHRGIFNRWSWIVEEYDHDGWYPILTFGCKHISGGARTEKAAKKHAEKAAREYSARKLKRQAEQDYREANTSVEYITYKENDDI